VSQQIILYLISKPKIAVPSPAEKFLKITQVGGKLDVAERSEVPMCGFSIYDFKIYDTQPVIDHFHLVDANTAAGAMDTRLMPEAGTYYFYLKGL
jgi:hypothetical protein